MPKQNSIERSPTPPTPAKKKHKSSTTPEKIKEGTVLTDFKNGEWRIGTSIGVGGFGEIYSATRLGEDNYRYAVKWEPRKGPLFLEMIFYARCAKQEEIEHFKRIHNLNSLGMPHMIASGGATINGLKHHFIVMPRYGFDLTKQFIKNGAYLPVGTVYRVAVQMLYVYEYVHSHGYVHGDLKGANILLGRGGGKQVYLVDYGLSSQYAVGDYKPSTNKRHTGTVEFTSRDAHVGVVTRRGDLEVLGYNLIKWLGGRLPWIEQKLLNSPCKVQLSKEAFVLDVIGNLKKLFVGVVPGPLIPYFKYVLSLTHDEKPNYNVCRKFFLSALADLNIPNSGNLIFTMRRPEPTVKANTRPMTDNTNEQAEETPKKSRL